MSIASNTILVSDLWYPSLISAIDCTKSVLNDIRVFNKDEWVVRYPQLREKEDTSEPEQGPSCRPKSGRRSLSFADDPTFETDVVLEGRPLGMGRSLTLANIHEDLNLLSTS